MTKRLAFLLSFICWVAPSNGFCVDIKVSKPDKIKGRIVRVEDEIKQFCMVVDGQEQSIHYTKKTSGLDLLMIGNYVQAHLIYIRGNVPVATKLIPVKADVPLDASKTKEESVYAPANDTDRRSFDETADAGSQRDGKEPASLHVPLVIYE